MFKQFAGAAVAACAILPPVASADIIAAQGFEGSASDTYGFSTDVAFYGVDGSRTWGIVDENGTQIPVADSGANFLGGRHLGSAAQTLSFDTLDVQSYTDIQVSFSFYSYSLDNTDYLDYTLNGLTQRFAGGMSDSDFTDGWETVVIDLNDVDSIGFGFEFRVFGSGDRFGIDSIVVSGTPVPAPASVAMIAAGLGFGTRRRRN